jgi:hypothetical protein
MNDRKKHLTDFLQFTTAHLGQVESQRLCRVVEGFVDDAENSFEALSDGIASDDGQQRGLWVLILVDWKAREEIAWQLNECLSAFGSSERWERDCESEFTDVPLSLFAVSEWLAKKGYALLHLETDSDYYCCFISKATDAAHIADLARAAELTLYDHASFHFR